MKISYLLVRLFFPELECSLSFWVRYGVVRDLVYSGMAGDFSGVHAVRI